MLRHDLIPNGPPLGNHLLPSPTAHTTPLRYNGQGPDLAAMRQSVEQIKQELKAFNESEAVQQKKVHQSIKSLAAMLSSPIRAPPPPPPRPPSPRRAPVPRYKPDLEPHQPAVNTDNEILRRRVDILEKLVRDVAGFVMSGVVQSPRAQQQPPPQPPAPAPSPPAPAPLPPPTHPPSPPPAPPAQHYDPRPPSPPSPSAVVPTFESPPLPPSFPRPAYPHHHSHPRSDPPPTPSPTVPRGVPLAAAAETGALKDAIVIMEGRRAAAVAEGDYTTAQRLETQIAALAAAEASALPSVSSRLPPPTHRHLPPDPPLSKCVSPPRWYSSASQPTPQLSPYSSHAPRPAERYGDDTVFDSRPRGSLSRGGHTAYSMTLQGAIDLINTIEAGGGRPSTAAAAAHNTRFGAKSQQGSQRGSAASSASSEPKPAESTVTKKVEVKTEAPPQSAPGSSSEGETEGGDDEDTAKQLERLQRRLRSLAKAAEETGLDGTFAEVQRQLALATSQKRSKNRASASTARSSSRAGSSSQDSSSSGASYSSSSGSSSSGSSSGSSRSSSASASSRGRSRR